MSAPHHRIDVHHHFFPPKYIEAMETKGVKEAGDAPIPAWSVDRSLSVMDTYAIATAVISIAAPGVRVAGRRATCDLARMCNECAAVVSPSHPGRFGCFAVLPMPHFESPNRFTCRPEP